MRNTETIRQIEVEMGIEKHRLRQTNRGRDRNRETEKC